MRTVKCPSCGAELTIKDNNRDFMFCEYCGTKVDLVDMRVEHRIIDEARVIEAETDRQVKLKHLEMETEEYEREKRKREKAAKRKARERQRDLDNQEASRKLILVAVVAVVLFLILGLIISAIESLVTFIGGIF